MVTVYGILFYNYFHCCLYLRNIRTAILAAPENLQKNGSMSGYSDTIKRVAGQLRQQLPAPVDCAVILGSGLEQVADSLAPVQQKLLETSYSELDCLPTPSAPGHRGKLSIVKVNGRIIALCHGRTHFYEGYTAQQVCAMVYLLNGLGAQQLVITNAAGALNPDYQPGQVMLISDHINLTGQNPLIGQDETFGSRFVDMSEPYSRSVVAATLQQFPHCHQGIYAGVGGPSLETSAERRMLRTLGADAVGMSTVLEVIAARQVGITVTGLSAITNLALGDENQKADTVEEVLHYAGIAGQQMAAIIGVISGAVTQA